MKKASGAFSIVASVLAASSLVLIACAGEESSSSSSSSETSSESSSSESSSSSSETSSPETSSPEEEITYSVTLTASSASLTLAEDEDGSYSAQTTLTAQVLANGEADAGSYSYTYAVYDDSSLESASSSASVSGNSFAATEVGVYYVTASTDISGEAYTSSSLSIEVGGYSLSIAAGSNSLTITEDGDSAYSASTSITPTLTFTDSSGATSDSTSAYSSSISYAVYVDSSLSEEADEGTADVSDGAFTATEDGSYYVVAAFSLNGQKLAESDAAQIDVADDVKVTLAAGSTSLTISQQNSGSYSASTSLSVSVLINGEEDSTASYSYAVYADSSLNETVDGAVAGVSASTFTATEGGTYYVVATATVAENSYSSDYVEISVADDYALTITSTATELEVNGTATVSATLAKNGSTIDFSDDCELTFGAYTTPLHAYASSIVSIAESEGGTSWTLTAVSGGSCYLWAEVTISDDIYEYSNNIYLTVASSSDGDGDSDDDSEGDSGDAYTLTITAESTDLQIAANADGSYSASTTLSTTIVAADGSDTDSLQEQIEYRIYVDANFSQRVTSGAEVDGSTFTATSSGIYYVAAFLDYNDQVYYTRTLCAIEVIDAYSLSLTAGSTGLQIALNEDGSYSASTSLNPAVSVNGVVDSDGQYDISYAVFVDSSLSEEASDGVASVSEETFTATAGGTYYVRASLSVSGEVKATSSALPITVTDLTELSVTAEETSLKLSEGKATTGVSASLLINGVADSSGSYDFTYAVYDDADKGSASSSAQVADGVFTASSVGHYYVFASVTTTSGSYEDYVEISVEEGYDVTLTATIDEETITDRGEVAANASVTLTLTAADAEGYALGSDDHPLSTTANSGYTVYFWVDAANNYNASGTSFATVTGSTGSSLSGTFTSPSNGEYEVQAQLKLDTDEVAVDVIDLVVTGGYGVELTFADSDGNQIEGASINQTVTLSANATDAEGAALGEDDLSSSSSTGYCVWFWVNDEDGATGGTITSTSGNALSTSWYATEDGVYTVYVALNYNDSRVALSIMDIAVTGGSEISFSLLDADDNPIQSAAANEEVSIVAEATDPSGNALAESDLSSDYSTGYCVWFYYEVLGNTDETLQTSITTDGSDLSAEFSIATTGAYTVYAKLNYNDGEIALATASLSIGYSISLSATDEEGNVATDTLVVGETYQLSLSPTNASQEAIAEDELSSNSESGYRVYFWLLDGVGTCTGSNGQSLSGEYLSEMAGEATIYAYLAYNNGAVAEYYFEFSVVDPYEVSIGAESSDLTLSDSSVSTTITPKIESHVSGEADSLYANLSYSVTVLNEDGTYGETENASVSVSEDGTVTFTATAEGTYRIVATLTVDGETYESDYITVTVTAASSSFI